MKVWAVANQKGGVGKTTTTVTLAGLLSQRGCRTLLVDLDPHGSLTSYFRLDPDDLEVSTYTLFQGVAQGTGNVPLSLIRPTGVECLDLIPASPALATLERPSGRRDGLGLLLLQALEHLQGHYEHVLIDCPPMLGVLMINALAACQHLIIPVQTEFLALKGLERMLITLDRVQQMGSRKAFAYTILPTLFDRRTRASMDALGVLQKELGEHLWSSVIPIDSQLREASRAGVPASLHNPNCRGVRAYGELLHDLQAVHPSKSQQVAG